ncbi:unnamed protein product, partial [Symbiodinium sp. CCMP2592]
MGAAQSTTGNNNPASSGNTNNTPAPIVIQLQLGAEQLSALTGAVAPGVHVHVPPSGSDAAGGASTTPGAAPHGAPPVPFPPPPPPAETEQYLRWCNRCKQQSYFREGICLNEWCSLAWSRPDVDLNVAKNWGGKKVEASVLNHGVHKAKKNRGQKRKIWWQKHLERKAGKWGGDYQGDDEENKEDAEEGKAPPPVDPNHQPLGKKDGPDDDHHDDPGRTVDSAGSAGLPYIYMPNCGDDVGPDFTDYVVEVAVAVVSFAGKMNGRSLGAVVAYKHAYVLPSLMGKPAAKKAMAKAKNGPKAAPKATAKELKKQEMEKAAKKKDQSNLVTTLKNAKTKLQGVQNGTIQVSDGELENLKNKAEFFDRYVSLDRNDPEKAQMLAAFLADKTCNNYMQKIREISTETKTEDEKASGFVTQWEIAAKENLPVDSPLLQKLLDGLKFDYDWNEAVPREKVFKEAGEKRFFYEKNAMTTEKTSFSSKSGITAAGDLGKKKADSFLNDKDTSTADPAAKVKIEFPLHVELVSSVKVLKSGKQKIQKELNTGKDLCQKLATGGGYDTTDLANAIDTFDNYLATLRQRIATAEEVQPPDVTKEVVAELKAEIDIADTHLDAFKRVSGEAAWMQPEHRKTPWQALMAAPSISPIFATPYVGTECIQMDWLHVVDIGIALQFLGSIMKYFCSKFEGTFDEQVREMFRCILEFYDVQAVEYRLDHLKPSMIKDPKKKFPKLRAKAGESRCLVPWAAQMADALRDADNEVEQTMYKCAWHFNKCYEQLSSRTFDAAVLAEHGVAFANLYVALHEHFTVQGVCLFKVTPKLHLFCEISYRGRDCPSVHWSYRDEDWGGKMAILAASKGGANTPNALANAFFSRFTSGHK